MFKGGQARRIEQEQSDESDTEDRPSKRPKRSTSQPDLAKSSRTQVGSSSPPHDDSQDDSNNGSQDGSYASSQETVGYVDGNEHYHGIMPKDNTVRLASRTIRYILLFAPPQNSPFMSTVVDFRDAKARITTKTVFTFQKIVAVDDGGLCLRREKEGSGPILENNHVAILEAKSRFLCPENGKPIISDKGFAQMICEALAIRVSKLKKGENIPSVIVINATQHYMCFFQMDMSDEYMADYESDAPTRMLYVSSTPWFDISQESGRKGVLANLYGIMRWARSGIDTSV